MTSIVAVTPGYFEGVRTTILRGRGFTADDMSADRAVAVINEAFVRRYWANDDPLGKRFRFDDDAPWRTVIGVARDIKAFGLSDDPNRLQMYYPMESHGRFGMFAIRATTDYADIVPMLEERVWAQDPDIPIREAASVEDLLIIIFCGGVPGISVFKR